VRSLLLVGAAVLLLGGCAGMKEAAEQEPLSAEAALKDKDGKDVGRATLIETKEGLRIAVTGYRLPPGTHGLHVHRRARTSTRAARSTAPRTRRAPTRATSRTSSSPRPARAGSTRSRRR
jgi:Cu/Zn superoxide dismutase